MSNDVRRYSDHEIVDAYTRFRVAIKGQLIDTLEYVLATDYDALEAEKKRQHEKIDKMLGYHVEDKARIAALEAALRKYGNHVSPCETGRSPKLLTEYGLTRWDCTCGFEAALAASNDKGDGT